MDYLSILPASPVVVLLIAAALCVVMSRLSSGGARKAQSNIGIVACAIHLICSSIMLAAVAGWTGGTAGETQVLALAVGGWQPPLGIIFVIDILAAVMLVLTGVIALGAMLYSRGGSDERGDAYPLMLVMLAGISGAFSTGDVFNLFVWFEVMLMASFVLLGQTNGRSAWRFEGAIKYLVLNLISSAVFLAGIGFLYAEYGTLNMADISLMSQALVAESGEGAPPIAAWLLFAAFAIKAGIFPCYLWLPGAYHVPNAMVSAVFAALLTKVGVYALIRLTTLIFDGQSAILVDILLVAGLVTMISGALGALAQSELRRILAFHVISQVGFMVVALGFGSAAALAAAVCYIVHHIIVKASLFFIAGLTSEMTREERLANMGGLAVRTPLLAVMFLLAALSLAGVPPLSGFVGKLTVIQAGIAEEAWVVIAICLLGGLLTLLSMLKIWLAVFWGKQPESSSEVVLAKPPMLRWAPAVLLVMITIAIGFVPEPLVSLANGAGEQLDGNADYLDSFRVLAGGEYEFVPVADDMLAPESIEDPVVLMEDLDVSTDEVGE